MTTSVIALLASAPSESLMDGDVPLYALLTALVGTFGGLAKAISDQGKAGGGSKCTSQTCRRVTEYEERFRISILAGLICVLLIGLVCIIIFSKRAAQTVAEEAAVVAKMEVYIRKEVTQKVNETNNLNNLISSLRKVRVGMEREQEILKDQVMNRADGSHENRFELATSVLNLKSIFSSQVEFCSFAEEVAGLAEAERLTRAFTRMQKDLALILFPNYYEEEAIRANLLPGQIMPELVEMSADTIWENRNQAVKKIESVYLPEIQRLENDLINKLGQLEKPEVGH